MTTASIPKPRLTRRHLDTEPPPASEFTVIEIREPVTQEQMDAHPLVIALAELMDRAPAKGAQP